MKSIRVKGHYVFEPEGADELEVAFEANYYHGHKEPGCPGGNCPCCYGPETEVDDTTIRAADGEPVDFTIGMFHEVCAAVYDDPEQWLAFPTEPTKDDVRLWRAGL